MHAVEAPKRLMLEPTSRRIEERPMTVENYERTSSIGPAGLTVDARLISRKNHEYKSFAELCAWIGENLKMQDAILDCEIACLDAYGRSVFNNLFYLRGTPYLFAFDMLWLNGKDAPRPAAD